MAVLHLPGAGGSLRDDIDHGFHVEAGAHAEVDGLGETLHQPGNRNLVAHLGELARAHRPQELPHAGEMHDERFGLRVVGLVAAAHDGKDAVLGPGLPA